ncbi:MAG: HDOD domain-containing protein [Candidatus Thorarchaeota archaeon]
MKLPDIRLVEKWLIEGDKRNPGLWIKHSRLVANAAKLIAMHIKSLNSEQAYIMGLIHDIGRIEGKNQERHTIDGFNFLKGKGYNELARICITHCFPNKDINANIGIWDCNESELNFIENFLKNCEYNDYDRLIQLCDCISMDDKYILIEKRLIDVALRYNLKDQIPLSVPLLKKWQKYLKIRQYFEEMIGKSIYSLLPNVIETTFGFKILNSK